VKQVVHLSTHVASWRAGAFTKKNGNGIIWRFVVCFLAVTRFPFGGLIQGR